MGKPHTYEEIEREYREAYMQSDGQLSMLAMAQRAFQEISEARDILFQIKRCKTLAMAQGLASAYLEIWKARP